MIRKNHSRKNGQSLVEMALLLPILLVLSVVTFDLGRGIYYYSTIYNAAREGARFGIIDPTDSAGIDTAARKLTIGLDQDRLTISSCECGKTCLSSNSACPVGAINMLNVRVSYFFRLITPMANLITGKSEFQLQSNSIMVIER